VLPRVAALLDVAQVSEIVEVVSADTFKRPIYAGNAIATVKSKDAKMVITVRGTAFAKAEKKGGTRAEVDEIICWLTGHSQDSLESVLANKMSLEEFFEQAPRMNPARSLITGVVCGVRVEQIEEPLMREIRYLDKLIDELAKGKSMEKILRK